MDLSVLWKISYGMYAVSVMDDQRPTGCIVNTVSQITSNEPVMIAVSVNKNNYTYGVIDKTKRFSVSVLSEQTPASVIGALGYASGKDTNKFANINYRVEKGLPLLNANCSGYFTCEVESIVDCGTHGIVLATVTDVYKGSDDVPMTYKYFHEVIKGKAPKNAPTYQAETPKPKEQYVCKICGYVYDGDITKEPDDYVCPICSAPKTLFEKKQEQMLSQKEPFSFWLFVLQ